MKVKFMWRISEAWNDGVLRPTYNYSNFEANFKGLIFSFLNDDEGHGIEYLSKWIDEGLIEIEKIKNGELDYYDMWGHAWGAEMTKGNVLIYWGYDNTPCEEKMTFEIFYKIINEWGRFLKTEPSLNSVIELEC